MPKTQEDWLKVAGDFERRWNFPHCIGALDGKHVAILPPGNSGSLYYNYKHFFSVVLLAVVDANYKFLYVDIGNYGRCSDGGVFNNSTLGIALAESKLNIPPSKQVASSEFVLPFVIVADDAFALKPYIMKPFGFRNTTRAQRVFNYRLSRARRLVESAFGILSQRFLVFKKPIPLHPDKVETIVMSSCCLHNFLLRNSQAASEYMSCDAVPLGNESTGMRALIKQGSNRASVDATSIRNKFCDYFNSEVGSVSWQNDYCE